MGCMWRIWARNKCSRCTTRSITSPREAAEDCEAAVSCAATPRAGTIGREVAGAACALAGTIPAPTNRNARISECRFRIGIVVKNLCYLKDHVQYHRRVRRLAIAQRRLEAKLPRLFHGFLIQPMSQTANHAQDSDFARSLQHRFHQHFAFDLLLPGVLGIDGDGLPKDFRGHDLGRSRLCRVRSGGWRRSHIRASKPSLLNHRSLNWPRVADRHAVAESGADHHATSPIGSAGAIARARSGGHIERSQLRDRDWFPHTGFGGYAMRIAEASGLYLLRRERDRWSGGAPGRENVGLDRSARNHRLRDRR